MDGEVLLDVAFEAKIIEWRGPAPFFFAVIPADQVEMIRRAARLASYGWGVVPVEVRIAETTFRTSLFPRDGGYVLPLKVAVRRETGIWLGDRVAVALRVARPRADP